MSLPEVEIVRQRIESCEQEDIRMYLKATYLFGTRAVELAGRRCSGEKDLVYGVKGTDCWTSKTEPPDIPQKDVAKILITAIGGQKEEALQMVDKLTQDVPVGVFKITIAKQKLHEFETPPYRLIGMPLIEEYEPWAKQVYDYFKHAGDDYVFPFNRAYVWGYLTHKQRLFKGLTYKIKRYNYSQVGLNETPYVVLQHHRHIKIHGLRHVRIDELIKRYHFDGLDLAAFVGWSTKSVSSRDGTPTQTGTYAEIREMWQRYIKKLCKVTGGTK